MDFEFFSRYSGKVSDALKKADVGKISMLAQALLDAWREGRQVFICGNGGSAANAMHIANDLFYGIAKGGGKGIRVHALPANQAVMTCLANDESYEDIFSSQLVVLGQPGDILIVFSGSGNSGNIIRAIEEAGEIGIKSFAVLGYSGGKCLDMADVAIHFPVDDMQIAEDMQVIVGHMIMQWLREKGPEKQ